MWFGTSSSLGLLTLLSNLSNVRGGGRSRALRCERGWRVGAVGRADRCVSACGRSTTRKRSSVRRALNRAFINDSRICYAMSVQGAPAAKTNANGLIATRDRL